MNENTCSGGGHEPKIIVDDMYANRDIRVYNRYSPSIRSERQGLKTVEEKVQQIGFLDNGTGQHQSNTVYNEKGLCPNITTVNGGGTQQIKVLTESVICASRGRYLNNDNTTEQQLEVNDTGLSNTLTSVAKDNYVLEKRKYRIRRLTPRESWRLMGFKDKDFDKAAEVNSGTALYKEAGNAIVRNTLVAILGQLFENKEFVYLTDE